MRQQTRGRVANDGDAELGIERGVGGYAARGIYAQRGKNGRGDAQAGGGIRQTAIHRAGRTRERRLIGTIEEKEILAVRSHVTKIET